MGNLKCFEIVFSETKKVYYPGDRVTGVCVVELKGDMKMRALRIFSRGIAKVQWTEETTSGDDKTTKYYNAEVNYFVKQQLLFGGDHSNIEKTLVEGRHEFNFAFDLPLGGIPSSFEGRNGNIRYWLKAEIDKPWSSNRTTEKSFTVMNPVDINKPEYLVPVERDTEKSVCCLLCTSGPVSINARTNKRGYCPGESIAISAEFENYSSRTVTPHVRLIQTQSFYAGNSSHEENPKYRVLTGSSVTPGNEAKWDALLKIPVVSPTITDCSVLKVNYYVKVTLYIPRACNLSLYLPVVIGTVAHDRMRHEFPEPRFIPEPQFVNSAFLPDPPSYKEALALPPPIDEPPTKAESNTGAVGTRDEDDQPGTMGDCHCSPPVASEVDPCPGSTSDGTVFCTRL